MANGGQCMHYVERKKRFCRMTVREGRQYCGEHQREVAGFEAERVPCPLDPTQQVSVGMAAHLNRKSMYRFMRGIGASFRFSTCYRSKLTRHLNVCNVKRKLDARPTFVVEGANLDDEATAAPPRVPLSQLDDSVVETVIRKIHAAYGTIESFN